MKTKITILIAFISFLFVFHLFGYIGHYGFDDLHYAKLASNYKNGIVDFDDHFTYRTPIIVLTSLSYSLFGISDFASSLPAIIVSSLILLVVFFELKDKPLITYIIGLSLTAFSSWFLFYSDKLMPDIYVVLSIIGTLSVIHFYKYKSNKDYPLIYAILVNLLLLFGFMAKGTIVLIIPLLIYYVCVDIILKRDIKFWRYTIISGIVIFASYFTVTWLITEDFFKRFEAITNNSYLNMCSYNSQAAIILLKRISYEFFKLTVYQTLATGFIFVLAYLISKKSTKEFKFGNSFSFWLTSSLILLLSSNFMTISLTSYSPMCLDPRHYLFLVPIVAIPASSIITEFINSKSYKIQIIYVTLFVAFVSFFMSGDSFWYLYMPLAVLFILYALVNLQKINRFIFPGLLIIILFLKPATYINYGQNLDYPGQREAFIKNILERKDSCKVVTNNVQKRLAEYYSKFDSNSIHEFYAYKDFKFDSTDKRKTILFLNWYTRYLSNMNKSDLPYYARYISEDNKLLYENPELNIEVYEIKDFSIPEKTEEPLLYTFNGFEENTEHWKTNKGDLTNKLKYEGKLSSKVPLYSSTFEYPLDLLNIKDFQQILIYCKLYCNFKDKTEALVVFSIEENGEAYKWYGLEVNKYLKAYSNWWPVKHEVLIKTNELKENSTLKVFLWNQDKKTAYIDNFEIKIIGLNN